MLGGAAESASESAACFDFDALSDALLADALQTRGRFSAGASALDSSALPEFHPDWAREDHRKFGANLPAPDPILTELHTIHTRLEHLEARAARTTALLEDLLAALAPRNLFELRLDLDTDRQAEPTSEGEKA